MSWVETLEHCANETRMVLLYTRVVKQSSWQTKVPVVGQLYTRVACGGIHMKREGSESIGPQQVAYGRANLGNGGCPDRH